MKKKIGKILTSLLLISFLQTTIYAENIFENLFSSPNSEKWTGVCQSIDECQNLRVNDEKLEELGEKYKNWILNADLKGKDYTKNGISFLNEVPGKATASLPVTIKNFQNEDTYTLSFDLVGVYKGKSFVDKPYLQINFGDFQAEEKDKNSVLSGKIIDIPKYNKTKNTTKFINSDTFKNQKGYFIDSDLLEPGRVTKVEIKTAGKEICKNCESGKDFNTNLNFSAILINNLTDKNIYIGSDFVIKNISTKSEKNILNNVFDKSILKEEIDKNNALKNEIIYKNSSNSLKNNYDETLKNSIKIFDKNDANKDEIENAINNLKNTRKTLNGEEKIFSAYSPKSSSLILKDDSRVLNSNQILKLNEAKIEKEDIKKEDIKKEDIKKEIIKNTSEAKNLNLKTKENNFVFEAVSPILSEKSDSNNLKKSFVIEPKSKENKFIKYPNILPKTGALDGNEIIKKVLTVKKLNNNVDISLPKAKTFRFAGNKNTDLNFWLEVLDKKYKNGNKYLVIPSSGLVIPINNVEESSKEAKNFLSGNNEDFSKYLENGSVELPGTANSVIGGHSSYWKNKKGDFKTHFQKIIGMEKNEEIWIYEKDSSGEFIRYVYEVYDSYNTKAEDIGILKGDDKNELVLFTCTPIGGNSGRWIVKSKFIGN